jgi:hypothetical protein
MTLENRDKNVQVGIHFFCLTLQEIVQIVEKPMKSMRLKQTHTKQSVRATQLPIVESVTAESHLNQAQQVQWLDIIRYTFVL